MILLPFAPTLNGAINFSQFCLEKPHTSSKTTRNLSPLSFSFNSSWSGAKSLKLAGLLMRDSRIARLTRTRSKLWETQAHDLLLKHASTSGWFGLLLEKDASIRGGGSICFIKLLEPGLRVDPIQQGIHIIVGVLDFHEPFLDVFISELPLLRMVHQRQD
ncbi:hypothetical protein AKJ16_DCAP25643 [Drosera capensis]